jgi:hypothetical protein
VSPREFLKIEAEQKKIIRKAEREIEKARRLAGRCPPPANRRRADVADVRPGRVIWHDDGDAGWFWNVVEEVISPGDEFKAYVADDGCRYGMFRAFVETRA